MKEKQRKKLNTILNTYIGIGFSLWAVAALLILTPIVPQIWYNLVPEASANEVASLTVDLVDDVDAFASLREDYLGTKGSLKPAPSLPPLNTSLTKANHLRIDKIGVDAPIQYGEEWESALSKGPWVVPHFGTPPANESPVIIASHRWGGIGWSSSDRATKSFLKLPDLQVGDKVEIQWAQRIYRYQIYAAVEDSQITDYEADLILYTCKLYVESPIRIFRYAKRIN